MRVGLPASQAERLRYGEAVCARDSRVWGFLAMSSRHDSFSQIWGGKAYLFILNKHGYHME